MGEPGEKREKATWRGTLLATGGGWQCAGSYFEFSPPWRMGKPLRTAARRRVGVETPQPFTGAVPIFAAEKASSPGQHLSPRKWDCPLRPGYETLFRRRPSLIAARERGYDKNPGRDSSPSEEPFR